MRVLLAEDEPDLASALARSLADESFAVDVAEDGDEALFRAAEIDYDAVILDVMLPHRDGWDVLRTLRAAGRSVPVLVLTARDAVEDRVYGLNLGADDYMVKPFSVGELVARLRALARRAAAQPSPVIEAANVRIDTTAHRVFRGDREIELTAREYSVLEVLVRSRGTVVTRTRICESLYSDATEVFSNTIDVHVAALRRKLGEGLIQTRRGIGYLIE